MNKSAIYTTFIGDLEICYTEHYITNIKFANGKPQNTSEPSDVSDIAIQQINEYLQGTRKTFDLPFQLNGTDFQKSVWNALCQIPYGETRSYQQIADTIGNPKAVRAVGMANNKNPLPIIIPCHRVIGKNGKLVGYAGGIEIKTKLLELEGVLLGL